MSSVCFADSRVRTLCADCVSAGHPDFLLRAAVPEPAPAAGERMRILQLTSLGVPVCVSASALAWVLCRASAELRVVVRRLFALGRCRTTILVLAAA